MDLKIDKTKNLNRVRAGFIRHLLMAALLFLIGCAETGKPLAEGSRVNDFMLPTLSHDRFYLNQHRGKVVLLVFWTTWCTQCKKELVDISALRKEFSEESLIIGAVCSDPENSSELSEISSSYKINYPVLLDTRAGLFKKFMLRGYPTTIVIGPSGKAEMIKLGHSQLTMMQIKKKIVTLLQKENYEN